MKARFGLAVATVAGALALAGTAHAHGGAYKGQGGSGTGSCSCPGAGAAAGGSSGSTGGYGSTAGQQSQAQQQQRTFQVTGTVAEVSPVLNNISILSSGQGFVVPLDIGDTSRVTINGRSVALNDIPAGSEVRATYSVRGNELVAQDITLVPASGNQAQGGSGLNQDLGTQQQDQGGTGLDQGFDTNENQGVDQGANPSPYVSPYGE